jgi:hypothetical protein
MNVNGKSVGQSDESLLAYEFKTVPGYEHTLIWVNTAMSATTPRSASWTWIFPANKLASCLASAT